MYIYTTSSALAGVIFFISTIIYTVGYYKLTGAIGKGNQSVRVIGLLARNIAICLVFTLLSSLSCKYSTHNNESYT